MPGQQSTEALPADAVLDANIAALDGALEPELQAHIGRQLRAMYNEVVNEPVPDRLLKLLQELEKKQADKS